MALLRAHRARPQTYSSYAVRPSLLPLSHNPNPSWFPTTGRSTGRRRHLSPPPIRLLRLPTCRFQAVFLCRDPQRTRLRNSGTSGRRRPLRLRHSGRRPPSAPGSQRIVHQAVAIVIHVGYHPVALLGAHGLPGPREEALHRRLRGI
ncbi:hypothetical protein BHM03_00060899 [Ensete ventricosum]|nr:hypothetical protein BHM03_00060899 [Ensete ventricosum]